MCEISGLLQRRITKSYDTYSLEMIDYSQTTVKLQVV